MGWPLSQKKVRVRRGSTSATQPNDQGMRKKTNSTTIPTLAIPHMMKVTRAPKERSGIRSPGRSRRQAR